MGLKVCQTGFALFAGLPHLWLHDQFSGTENKIVEMLFFAKIDGLRLKSCKTENIKVRYPGR